MPTYQSGGIGATEENIKTNPAEVLAFVKGSARGLHFARQNRDEATKENNFAKKPGRQFYECAPRNFSMIQPASNWVTATRTRRYDYGGVMERFPQLKVAFLEGNCSWIPWLLWRMGEYAELTGAAEHPELKLKPVEYFQPQCWGAVECDEVTAKNLRDSVWKTTSSSQPIIRTSMSSIPTRWKPS